MHGAIIGDIIGSIYEFDNCRSKDFPIISKGSTFTDDTAMTIAVADALSEFDGDIKKLKSIVINKMVEIYRKYPNLSYGCRFSDWLESESHKPYNSYGNGAPMRISPVAMYAHAKHLSYEDAFKISDAITGVSHNHPYAIHAARCLTELCMLGYNKCDKTKIENSAKFYYPELKQKDISVHKYRETLGFDESSQGTMPVAIQCFLESENFEDAIRNAISVGGDSDTISCITGAIAEAYYGIKDCTIPVVSIIVQVLPKDLLRKTERFLDIVTK